MFNMWTNIVFLMEKKTNIYFEPVSAAREVNTEVNVKVFAEPHFTRVWIQALDRNRGRVV